jgi:hypothetical protein
MYLVCLSVYINLERLRRVNHLPIGEVRLFVGDTISQSGLIVPALIPFADVYASYML